MSGMTMNDRIRSGTMNTLDRLINRHIQRRSQLTYMTEPEHHDTARKYDELLALITEARTQWSGGDDDAAVRLLEDVELIVQEIREGV